MDMGRTCVNLIGNCLAPSSSRLEGEFDVTRPKSSAPPPKPSSTLKSGIAFAEAVRQDPTGSQRPTLG